MHRIPTWILQSCMINATRLLPGPTQLFVIPLSVAWNWSRHDKLGDSVADQRLSVARYDFFCFDTRRNTQPLRMLELISQQRRSSQPSTSSIKSTTFTIPRIQGKTRRDALSVVRPSTGMAVPRTCMTGWHRFSLLVLWAYSQGIVSFFLALGDQSRAFK